MGVAATTLVPHLIEALENTREVVHVLQQMALAVTIANELNLHNYYFLGFELLCL